MAVCGQPGQRDGYPDTGDLGAVVALKPPDVAKSRLDLPDALRRSLARSMAVDTVAALAAVVTRLVVVSDDRSLQHALSAAGVTAQVLPEPSPDGMNHALEAGSQSLRKAGCATILACVGDLPALRAASVRALVETVRDHNSGPTRRFLADASGTGTTMLLAIRTRLDPRFGAGSAAAHQAFGAVEVTDAELPAPVPDARTDVDVVSDLDAVIRLGLGPATTAVVGSKLFEHRSGRLAS